MLLVLFALFLLQLGYDLIARFPLCLLPALLLFLFLAGIFLV